MLSVEAEVRIDASNFAEAYRKLREIVGADMGLDVLATLPFREMITPSNIIPMDTQRYLLASTGRRVAVSEEAAIRPFWTHIAAMVLGWWIWLSRKLSTPARAPCRSQRSSLYAFP